jgi:hypothetical protein
MPEASERLHVKVRLLSEPALWCWEIYDRHSGRVVESSWATNWVAYTSRAEAEAAGNERLRWHAIREASMPPEGDQGLARAS